ncbi:MAG: hypothetical protein LBQ52_05320 [Helicobacteraceae bacterium]|jgi:hypothetical protein|nr:hypothetical protein [Helicobacteraceae bacterium]
MGELIGVYKRRAIGFLFLWGVVAVNCAIGSLILLRIYPSYLSAVGSDEPVLWFIALGIAPFILGAAVILQIFVLKATQHNVELYENGVIIKGKKGDISLRFCEIEDILLVFSPNNPKSAKTNSLVFRKSADSAWYLIGAIFRDHLALIKGFVSRHTQQRGLAQAKEIEKEGFTSFKYLDESALKKSRLPNMINLQKCAEYKTLYLTKDHIKIDDKIISLESGDQLETGDRICVKDSNSNAKLSIPYLAVFSPDVFIAILSTKTLVKQ